MMMAYSVDTGRLKKVDCSADPSALLMATWIDLLDPTTEQVSLTVRVMGVSIPTQNEMRALEVSSQIHRDGSALIMTARVVSRSVERPLFRPDTRHNAEELATVFGVKR